MAGAVLRSVLDLDFHKISEQLQQSISDYISNSGANGLVVGLSGGLDSSVVAALGVNALGPKKIFGIIMPSKTTPKDDIEHAIELANILKIEYKIIDLEPLLKQYSMVLPEDDKKARGNLMARIRMNILYHYAFIKGLLVAGTGDKSEYLIGYFTKFGDGGADIMPIVDLYKTQVRALGKSLGVPQKIIEKRSSPRLWENHLAEEEIGLEYESVDSILYMLIDKKMKIQDIAVQLQIPLEYINRITNMVEKSLHKRKLPEMLIAKG